MQNRCTYFANRYHILMARFSQYYPVHRQGVPSSNKDGSFPVDVF